MGDGHEAGALVFAPVQRRLIAILLQGRCGVPQGAGCWESGEPTEDIYSPRAHGEAWSEIIVRVEEVGLRLRP